jgi:8-oxo-dGTP pyrophosphatase MutT (NUDIX family)
MESPPYAGAGFVLLSHDGLSVLLVKDARSHKWGFPKGRKNYHETDLQCAMREFHEETNLSRHTYSLLQNVQPIVESFVGSNQVSYCHKYMIAMCDSNQTVALTPLNPDMCREIGQIGWFTVEEALAKLRPENTTKRESR